MSDNVSHEELQTLIMNLMFDAMNQGAGWVGPAKIGQVLEISSDRVSLAATRLVQLGDLRARYNTRSGATYQISENAYVEIEQFQRESGNRDLEVAADPTYTIEIQLAPAVDRMVSFGDNQTDKEDILQAIEEAQRIILSSNLLDAQFRDETVLSLDTWKNLAANGRRFAVGGFRYLVWDRIKAVIEGVIEDAYRLALTGILLTIGTIIVGLL